MDVAEFKNAVMDYTRKINEGMNCIIGPAGEKYGLTMMQVRILMELNRCDIHTIGSLANNACVAGANVSAMCKKLEALGLLERVRNREDERVVRVILTEAGRETIMAIDRFCNEKIQRHLINETEDTFKDIITGLEKLSELMGRISCVEK